MLRIKRTKGEGDMVLVHYATAVTAEGAIGGWSRDAADAVAITQGVAKRVAEFYRGKKNVGLLDCEMVDASAAQLAAAVTADDAVDAKEFTKLQKRCKQLEAAVGELENVADDARAAVRAADQREHVATRMVADMQADAGDQVIRNATLAARVADLEAELAKVTEAATQPPEEPAPTPPEPVQPKHHKRK